MFSPDVFAQRFPLQAAVKIHRKRGRAVIGLVDDFDRYGVALREARTQQIVYLPWGAIDIVQLVQAAPELEVS